MREVVDKRMTILVLIVFVIFVAGFIKIERDFKVTYTPRVEEYQEKIAVQRIMPEVVKEPYQSEVVYEVEKEVVVDRSVYVPLVVDSFGREIKELLVRNELNNQIPKGTRACSASFEVYNPNPVSIFFDMEYDFENDDRQRHYDRDERTIGPFDTFEEKISSYDVKACRIYNIRLEITNDFEQKSRKITFPVKRTATVEESKPVESFRYKTVYKTITDYKDVTKERLVYEESYTPFLRVRFDPTGWF